MGWNAEEKAMNYLEALEQLKDMLKDFDYDEDWDHANTTARCLAWLSGNENWFAVADEYWKKQQQKEIKEDIAKKEGTKKMTKPIEDYTADELSAKIEAIKAERERTANALKRYEEELERREQEVHLGVPAERKAYAEAYFVNCTGDVINQPLDPNDTGDKRIFNMFDVFTTEASAERHVEMLLAWRKALVANSKGEPIDIKVLLPLLSKGWVAMDKDGEWFWYECKPSKEMIFWDSNKGRSEDMFFPINLKRADNWEESLMECGL